MYTPFYNAIKAIINTDLPEVKGVDYFNDQYSRYEQLKANAFPFIYVEFQNPGQWEDMGNKTQMSQTTISLHIVVFDVGDSPQKVLDLAQKAYLKFHGKNLMNGLEQISTGLSRKSNQLVTRYSQLKVMILTFDATLFDCSAMPAMPNTTNPSLDLSAD